MTCRLCGQCFGLHLTTCPRSTAVAEVRPPRRTNYVAPSRRGRIPRSEYLAEVSVTPEHKAAVNRAKQARYRARRRAS